MDKIIRIAAALTVLLGLTTLRCSTCCYASSIPVTDSSAISGFHYEKARAELVIDFTNGECYLIGEVPETIFHGFSKAESKGLYFNREIKGKFPSSKQ